MVTEEMAALRLAALHGVGVVQLPTMMVRDDLAAGTLMDVLPHWAPHSGIVHANFPSRRGLLPSVRALLELSRRSSHGSMTRLCRRLSDRPDEPEPRRLADEFHAVAHVKRLEEGLPVDLCGRRCRVAPRSRASAAPR